MLKAVLWTVDKFMFWISGKALWNRQDIINSQRGSTTIIIFFSFDLLCFLIFISYINYFIKNVITFFKESKLG